MDVQTRPYQKGDEKSLSEILKKIYHQEFTDEYWWWKYLDNPLGDHFCHCAILEDRIVGFAGAIPYRIKWGDRTIVAAQVTDLAVEPELEGKKVFSLIQKVNWEDTRENTDAFYGFANKHSYRIYHKKIDYAFRVPRMVKVLNATALLKNRKLSTAAVKVVGAVGNMGFRIAERLRAKQVTSDLTIKAITAFDPLINAFLETVSPCFKMMHVRNHHYLNWRYCHHPLYQYAIYTVEEANRILGFMVLRNEPGATHRGFILEFLAAPGREDVQHLLLNKATEHFRHCGVDIVICWVFHHSPYYRAFRRHLFMNRKGDLIVLVHIHQKNDVLKDDFRNPLNWHISCGDDESF